MVSIRDLYRPIQPAVSSKTPFVTYQEFLPHTTLQPYIYCFWRLRAVETLKEPFFYRIVSDGCIDIFFQLDDTKTAFAMGFCKEYTAYDLGSKFDYVGVRFLPSMFPQLFDISAIELSNVCEPLDNVLPKVASYIQSCFYPLQSEMEIIDVLNNYFLNLISSIDLSSDKRFYNAMEVILKEQGVLELDFDTGISSRQLRRLFHYYLGQNAKTFAKVVRFQNILKAKPTVTSLKKHKIFYDLGYFDQSHFIKDFKSFYGVTPAKAFR